MRIIVTGANGFVGSHVTRKLAASGHEIMLIDNLRYGPWRYSGRELGGVKALAFDLRDRDRTLEEVGAFNPEAIIHLAAIHFIPECERLPHEAVSINLEATVNLLAACPPGARFVFASTAAVYQPSYSAHSESESAIGPMDVYGHTKLAGEELVRYYATSRQFSSVIVRLFNVVGPGETNPHVVPEIIGQLGRGARELRLGNVKPKRDYIYAGDAADGFIAAATRPFAGHATVGEPSGPLVVNLGSGRSYSVEELVARLGEVVGAPIAIATDPSKVRKSDRPQLLADITRMKSVFGWAPAYTIDSALQATWDAPDMLASLTAA